MNMPLVKHFPIRNLKFFVKHSPQTRYWMGNSAGLTYAMLALSAMFPAGERFFIQSVRKSRQNPKAKHDINLQQQITNFIAQEAIHTREHINFNQYFLINETCIAELEQKTDEAIQLLSLFVSELLGKFGISKQESDLFLTAALEHCTATISAQFLKSPKFNQLIQDPEILKFWVWHAIEEMEHKNVAFDLLESISKDSKKYDVLRAMTYIFGLSGLSLCYGYCLLYMFIKDNKINYINVLNDIYQYSISPSKGILFASFKEIAAFLRPDFHPNQANHEELVAFWKEKIKLDVNV
ncbi:metal-dependent hydrolase [Acinetobacter brisouii]|uniref:metal-dependent hydrolase n=1 Tax=Acinetobacter brisouii TaxID=396323 RepID=UPI000B13E81B|nr:metal-dependent hydrolase [Acinetobacter brisouii]